MKRKIAALGMAVCAALALSALAASAVNNTHHITATKPWVPTLTALGKQEFKLTTANALPKYVFSSPSQELPSSSSSKRLAPRIQLRSANRMRSCEHRIEKAAVEFRRSLRELDANAIQRRADARAESAAKERLYRAEYEQAPPRLLNLAKVRVKEEGKRFGRDLKSGRRLIERTVNLSRSLRIQRLRCPVGFLGAAAAAALDASSSPLGPRR